MTTDLDTRNSVRVSRVLSPKPAIRETSDPIKGSPPVPLNPPLERGVCHRSQRNKCLILRSIGHLDLRESHAVVIHSTIQVIANFAVL
jgi:hypothetical protein